MIGRVLRAAADRCVPDAARASPSDTNRYRAVAYTLLLVWWIQLISVVIYVALRDFAPGTPEIVALAYCCTHTLVAAIALRWVRLETITYVSMASAVIASTALCSVTGGVRSPWLSVYVTLPTGALSARGPGAVRSMSRAIVAALLAMLIAQAAGVLPPSPIPDDRWPYFAAAAAVHCIVLVALATIASEHSRAASRAALHAAKERAEADARVLEQSRAELAAARDAALDAGRAKSMFLATMSHELRTPMTGILGMIELLAGTRLDEEQSRWVSSLKGSAGALLAVLNDVLDLSKIEHDRLTLESRPFEPAQVLEDTHAMFLGAATTKGIALELRIDGPRDALLGDAARLRQVLTNIVGNAVKFTAAGRVQIHARLERAEGERRLLSVEVTDTGIGMTAEELTMVFEPFVQASRDVTRRFGGTGLGLAIAKRIVEAMGGVLAAESERGVGSTFRIEITLPRAQMAQVPSRHGLTPRPTAPHGRRVLLVDDDSVIRTVVSRMLARMGHDVSAAESAFEALELARSTRFDVGLVDVHMPDLDGIALARAIRALPEPYGALPLWALTADPLEERREAARAAGISGVLLKPVQWQDLDEVLLELAEKAAKQS